MNPNVLLLMPREYDHCRTHEELKDMWHITFPPLGLLYIGTVLERNGYRVRVIDFSVENHSRQEFEELLRSFQPAVVGISVCATAYCFALILARAVKRVLSDSVIVFGGPLATFCYKEVLENQEVSCVVRSEGEYAMLDIMRYVESNKTSALSEIPGLVVRGLNGVVVGPHRELIKDLDSLPYPNRNLVDLSLYSTQYTISTSRGCPAKCIFCSSSAFWKNKYRIRSASDVFSEVELLKEQYPAMDRFVMAEDTFTADYGRCMKFCELLQNSNLAQSQAWLEAHFDLLIYTH